MPANGAIFAGIVMVFSSLLLVLSLYWLVGGEPVTRYIPAAYRNVGNGIAAVVAGAMLIDLSVTARPTDGSFFIFVLVGVGLSMARLGQWLLGRPAMARGLAAIPCRSRMAFGIGVLGLIVLLWLYFGVNRASPPWEWMKCLYVPFVQDGASTSKWGSWQSVAQLSVALNAAITTYLAVGNAAEERKVEKLAALAHSVRSAARWIAPLRGPRSIIVLHGQERGDLEHQIKKIQDEVANILRCHGLEETDRHVGEVVRRREDADVSGYVWFAMITAFVFCALIYSSAHPDATISRLGVCGLFMSYVPFVTAVPVAFLKWRKARRDYHHLARLEVRWTGIREEVGL